MCPLSANLPLFSYIGVSLTSFAKWWSLKLSPQGGLSDWPASIVTKSLIGQMLKKIGFWFEKNCKYCFPLNDDLWNCQQEVDYQIGQLRPLRTNITLSSCPHQVAGATSSHISINLFLCFYLHFSKLRWPVLPHIAFLKTRSRTKLEHQFIKTRTNL